MTLRGFTAAMLLGVGVLTGCGDTSTKPSATSAPPPPRTVTLRLADLAHGPKPKVEWFDGTTLFSAGRTVELGTDNIVDVGTTHDYIVTHTFNFGSSVVRVLDFAGRFVAEYPGQNSRLATNADRSIVAWIGGGGYPMAVQDGYDTQITLPGADRGTDGDAIAVRGKDCLSRSNDAEDVGCSIYFTVRRGEQAASLVSTNHESVTGVSRTITQLKDVSKDGALIGLTAAAKDHHICSRYESRTKSYGTCAFLPESFSPNGRHFIAAPSRVIEGVTTNEFSIRDAKTGRPVVTARSPKETWSFWSAVWENNDNILILVEKGDQWAVVRLSLDGEAEIALGLSWTDVSAFRFVTQP